ncbi:hypothetical protein RvY_00619 [Ramazzottius varieornatus]|uniref:DNA fragmentation factor 40 C-terminal domain-containing protein n=1 Tax=Ramazzottius varieornatus TaxID=947166 RepID=A0A1D1UJN5_RAMVA|nr:hypothetical protein RvY_00619 [Ramazzottius varieornatus]
MITWWQSTKGKVEDEMNRNKRWAEFEPVWTHAKRQFESLRTLYPPSSIIDRDAVRRICMLDGTVICTGPYNATFCPYGSKTNGYEAGFPKESIGTWPFDHFLGLSVVRWALVGDSATSEVTKQLSKEAKKLRSARGLIREAAETGMKICIKELYRLHFEALGDNPNMKLVCPACNRVARHTDVAFERRYLLCRHLEC